MARQFNGSSDLLNSASALTLVNRQITVSMWLWVDAFSNDDRTSLVWGNFISPTVGFFINPNASGSTQFEFGQYNATNATFGVRSFTRPSAAAWHQYVFTLDSTISGSLGAVGAWVDHVSQTTSAQGTDFTPAAYTSETLALMARITPALWLAGRQAEVVIWDGLNFSQTDVDNLWNSGLGTDARNVQNGTLKYYWQECGTDSPEPALVGGVNMTVTGTTAATHPISGVGICGGAAAPIATGLQDIGWMAMNPAWR